MKKYPKAFESYWLLADPILFSDWEGYAAYRVKQIAYNAWMAGRRHEKKNEPPTWRGYKPSPDDGR